MIRTERIASDCQIGNCRPCSHPYLCISALLVMVTHLLTAQCRLMGLAYLLDFPQSRTHTMYFIALRIMASVRNRVFIPIPTILCCRRLYIITASDCIIWSFLTARLLTEALKLRPFPRSPLHPLKSTNSTYIPPNAQPAIDYKSLLRTNNINGCVIHGVCWRALSLLGVVKVAH